MSSDRELTQKMLQLYSQSGCEQDGETKIKRVQDRKTTYIEPNDSGGRTIYMNEFKVEGKTYWAGYSSKTQTVYISLSA
jgi:hypothetical protein